MALCPNCHKTSIFSGFLSVHEKCPQCGYALGSEETGDGPMFFVIVLMGFLICGLAVWVELRYQPPMWLHAVIWGPAIIILSPLMLRLSKGWLITYQYGLSQNKENHD